MLYIEGIWRRLDYRKKAAPLAKTAKHGFHEEVVHLRLKPHSMHYRRHCCIQGKTVKFCLQAKTAQHVLLEVLHTIPPSFSNMGSFVQDLFGPLIQAFSCGFCCGKSPCMDFRRNMKHHLAAEAAFSGLRPVTAQIDSTGKQFLIAQETTVNF